MVICSKKIKKIFILFLIIFTIAFTTSKRYCDAAFTGTITAATVIKTIFAVVGGIVVTAEIVDYVRKDHDNDIMTLNQDFVNYMTENEYQDVLQEYNQSIAKAQRTGLLGLSTNVKNTLKAWAERLHTTIRYGTWNINVFYNNFKNPDGTTPARYSGSNILFNTYIKQSSDYKAFIAVRRSNNDWSYGLAKSHFVIRPRANGIGYSVYQSNGFREDFAMVSTSGSVLSPRSQLITFDPSVGGSIHSIVNLGGANPSVWIDEDNILDEVPYTPPAKGPYVHDGIPNASVGALDWVNGIRDRNKTLADVDVIPKEGVINPDGTIVRDKDIPVIPESIWDKVINGDMTADDAISVENSDIIVKDIVDDVVVNTPEYTDDLVEDIPVTDVIDWGEQGEYVSGGLTTLFPFCIPFDLIRAFDVLQAEPQAPRYELPLKIPGIIDYTLVIDMEVFEPVAQIFRILSTLAFIISLILVTRYIIKG